MGAGFVNTYSAPRATMPAVAVSRGPATFSMQVKGLGSNADQRPIEMIHADADAAFKMLDVDNEGSIDNEKLRKYLYTRDYSPELVDKVFAGIDVDKGGDIDADELRTAFVKFPTLCRPSRSSRDPCGRPWTTARVRLISSPSPTRSSPWSTQATAGHRGGRAQSPAACGRLGGDARRQGLRRDRLRRQRRDRQGRAAGRLCQAPLAPLGDGQANRSLASRGASRSVGTRPRTHRTRVGMWQRCGVLACGTERVVERVSRRRVVLFQHAFR